ncbi:MAG: polyprenyl synthetase family protein [Candidatus Bathyarchaeia archaeon]
MKTSKKLMEKVQKLLKKRGEKAFEMARDAILKEKNIDERVYKALRYFIEESWYNVQHPALLSLACEAVGGSPEKTTAIGAAMVLLTGAADIHDDILDKSKIKNSKPTVFGKFGKDVALLAGDALLFQGLTLLHEACEELPYNTKKVVLNLIRKAFFELGNAEVKEIDFRAKYDIKPQEYRKIIEAKAAVAEATARIGAILGNGKPEEVETLGHYGRTLGTLMTIRDDFIDLFEPDELKNRARNECLPLPLLHAFQNTETKNKVVEILRKNEITNQEVQEILDLVLGAREVEELKKEMRSLIKQEKNLLQGIKRNSNILHFFLSSTLEDL